MVHKKHGIIVVFFFFLLFCSDQFQNYINLNRCFSPKPVDTCVYSGPGKALVNGSIKLAHRHSTINRIANGIPFGNDLEMRFVLFCFGFFFLSSSNCNWKRIDGNSVSSFPACVFLFVDLNVRRTGAKVRLMLRNALYCLFSTCNRFVAISHGMWVWTCEDTVADCQVQGHRSVTADRWPLLLFNVHVCMWYVCVCWHLSLAGVRCSASVTNCCFSRERTQL